MTEGRAVPAGPDVMLRLTPGTSITFIDDHPFIVSKGRQALFEVNQIGGYIGCRLEDGVSFSQLAQEVTDRGYEPASAMLQSVLAQWSHSGLIYAMESPPATAPVSAQSIALAGMRLCLRYHDAALASLVAPVFAHLEEADSIAADIVYDLWSADGLALLSRDRGRAAMLHFREAAPVVKAWMIQDIIGDGRWGLTLHAGCLRRNGRALLLTGRPGAGKSTLIAWLLSAGFAYQGDDIAMFHSDGRVQGLPFLPTIKSGGWPMMAARYGRRLRPGVHVRPDGKRVRYLEPVAMAGQQPLNVGWIVQLRRRRGCPARLEPLPSTLVIRHLLSEATSPSGEVDSEALDALISTVMDAGGFALHYDDLDEAATLLARLCGHGAA